MVRFSSDASDVNQDSSLSSWSLKISYEKLQLFCRYPVWNMLQEFIRSTRSYREGLALSVGLITTAEQNSNCMSPTERELYHDRLWLFHLNMLDKLDMWPEYLNCFDKLRDDVSHCHKWKRTSGILIHPHILHYMCGEASDHVSVHFLIGVHERKEIIVRKLQRSKSGKSTGHLQHHKRDALSSAELRERVDFLVRKFTPYMPLC